MSEVLEDIEALLDRRNNPGATHYDRCYADHIDCAARVLLGMVKDRDQHLAVGATMMEALAADRERCEEEVLDLVGELQWAEGVE